jgi:uncharacterized membrane protein SpoIIM required for sporulation/ABC-type transport system involved in multi-copper enzyme maturation permease subunit
MLDKTRLTLVITRREVRDQFRDWRIVGPVLMMALLFPLLMNYAAGEFIDLAHSNGAQVSREQVYPFFLMIVGFFPLSVSLVIALESFVGEKERHSIEPLLSSPLSDLQLYLGKLFAALVIPLLASYLGMTVFLLIIYTQGTWWFDWVFLLQIYTLATVNGLVMISGAVVISTQATSMRAANLLSAFIILPMAALLFGQSAIIVRGATGVVWWTILGEIAAVILLVRAGVSHFSREEMLGREFDILDLRWGWNVFWDAFLGEARSPIEWYRYEIRSTLRRLALPLLLVTLLMVVGMLVGANFSNRWEIPPELVNKISLSDGYIQGLESTRFFDAGNVPVVWMHNLRAILLATFLGIFSFGALAMVALLAPLVLTGFFAATMAQIHLSPWLFLTAFVLPHGILEIPAIILAGAAILRLGATLITPSRGYSISEAWLAAFADWTRVILAIVVPMLLGAALLEVLITPRVVVLLFGQ